MNTNKEKKSVEVQNLVYRYIDYDENEVYAINDISFEVKSGEFVAIVGHNGSGKSTTAKHINALLSPYQGSVFVDGMNTSDKDKIWDIRRTAGMVFQNPENQMVATIVEEDVAFGPENLGIPSQEIREIVDRSLKQVHMLKHAGAAPHYLSGGQKQRVAIAGILAMMPKIIVLDEPTAMLDPMGRKEVISTVHRLNKEYGISIILITHFMEEAVHADRVIVMDSGKITLNGTPQKVFAQVDNLIAAGLNVPQVTNLANKLNKKGLDLGHPLTVKEMADSICQSLK